MTEIEKELNRRADIIIRQEKQIEIDAKQIRALQKQNGELTDKVKELKAQIEKMKKELHHRLVSPSHDDSDCLDKIVMLDRLWQFGQEF